MVFCFSSENNRNIYGGQRKEMERRQKCEKKNVVVQNEKHVELVNELVYIVYEVAAALYDSTTNGHFTFLLRRCHCANSSKSFMVSTLFEMPATWATKSPLSYYASSM
jgi:hypothetical protein